MTSCPVNLLTWISLGYLLIFVGSVWTIVVLWFLKPWMKTGICIIITALLVWLGWDQGLDAYQARHMKEFVTVWERNGEQWDGGEKDVPIRVDSHAELVSSRAGRLWLTPQIGNDSLNQIVEAGTDVTITVTSASLTPRLSLIVKEHCDMMSRNTFHCVIPEGITPRGTRTSGFRKGPNEYLAVDGFAGWYKIEYTFTGKTSNNCTFTLPIRYWARILSPTFFLK